MKYLSHFLVVALLAWGALLLPPPAAAADRDTELLTGFWTGGAADKEGNERKWLVERRKDGTQRITFRWYRNGVRVKQEVTEGTWSQKGGVYYSAYLVVDGRQRETPARFSYSIVTLNESEFVYRSHTSDSLFTVKRVGPTFELP